MKKIYRITAFAVIILLLISLSDGLGFSPTSVYASGDLTVNWGVPAGNPIFVVANMAPGQMETRVVGVTNGSASPRQVGVKAANIIDANNLSTQLDLVVTEGVNTVYGPITLKQFFTDTAGPNAEAILSTLGAGSSTNYTFKVTFKTSAGNAYQGKSTTFDLIIGLAFQIPADCQNITFDGPPIIGTSHVDNIKGTGKSELIMGLEGADKIDGGGGDDCILGGTGHDTISGGTGNDVIFGEEGEDIMRGETGNDILIGAEGADDMSGGSGNDLLVGGIGADTMDGGSDNDHLLGDGGADKMKGGDGNDLMEGGDAADNMMGESGNDTMNGDDGTDKMDGGGDNDIIHGNDGTDDMKGGSGNDTIIGDGGPNDKANGEGGTDTCNAENETSCEI